jgi:hypothetical protein
MVYNTNSCSGSAAALMEENMRLIKAQGSRGELLDDLDVMAWF